jgi:cytochrome c biogenesis protein CcmG, thiol:disulfide interchange protein DsbE
VSAGPSAGHSRRGLIGPFSGRQIALTLLVVSVAAVVLVIVSSPIPAAAPPVPSVGSGFVAVGAATAGLQAGQVAPELAGPVPSDDPSHLLAIATLLGGAALLVLGLVLTRRVRAALLLAVAGLVVALVSLPLLLAPEPPAQVVGLSDLEGRPIRLADLKGRPIWIDFFATWCPPCQQETPTLQKLYEEHRAEGLVLLAVSVQETSADDVRAYATRYGLTFPIGFDATSAVFKAYQAYGLPTQLFIGRDGIIRSVVRGPVSELTGEQNLAPILSGTGASPGP